MSKHPHRVHEKTCNHRILNKIVYVRKTRPARVGVTEPVLVDTHNVAVYVATRERKVFPYSQQIKEAGYDIEPCLAASITCSDDFRNLLMNLQFRKMTAWIV